MCNQGSNNKKNWNKDVCDLSSFYFSCFLLLLWLFFFLVCPSLFLVWLAALRSFPSSFVKFVVRNRESSSSNFINSVTKSSIRSCVFVTEVTDNMRRGCVYVCSALMNKISAVCLHFSFGYCYCTSWYHCWFMCRMRSFRFQILTHYGAENQFLCCLFDPFFGVILCANIPFFWEPFWELLKTFLINLQE